MRHIKLKKAVMFIAFLVTFIPLVAHAEGTIQLPQTGQTKCYDSAGTEIEEKGTDLFYYRYHMFLEVKHDIINHLAPNQYASLFW